MESWNPTGHHSWELEDEFDTFELIITKDLAESKYSDGKYRAVLHINHAHGATYGVEVMTNERLGRLEEQLAQWREEHTDPDSLPPERLLGF